MKRIFALLLSLVLVLGMLSNAFAMPTDHDVTYKYVKTTHGGTLSLREDQSIHAKKVANIPYGTKVMLYDYKPGDTWAWCVYNDVQGFVMTRYLSKSKPAAVQSGSTDTASTVGSESGEYKKMEPAYYYATVRPGTPTGFVHMRWAPSKKEPIQRDYYNGQVLKVLYQDKNWCQVYDETNDVTGYMMRQFLTYVAPVVSPLTAADDVAEQAN